jgi:hypothetical protein
MIRINHYIETVILPALVDLQIAVTSFIDWISGPGCELYRWIFFRYYGIQEFAPVMLALLVVGFAFVLSSTFILYY